MQAWALQRVLRDLGHSPITIDRRTPKRGVAYDCARAIYRSAGVLIGRRLGPIFENSAYSKITENTRQFIRGNIELSSRMESTEDLAQHFKRAEYDAAIVGSDQTWRPLYSPDIYNFFLDFIPDGKVKKIAYATSFGVDTWDFSETQTRKCALLAKSFSFVGVREASGVHLCLTHLGIDAHHVLDPTLLLRSEDYDRLLDTEINADQSGRGLYTYLLDATTSKREFVEKSARTLGLRVCSNQAPNSIHHWNGGPLKNYIMPKVTDWLSGFKNSEFIITDSFHGMVFAIIFRKPFVVISNAERGSARFLSLLNQLGATKHLVSATALSSSPDFCRMNLAPPNCYSEKIEYLRKHSLAQLSAQLK